MTESVWHRRIKNEPCHELDHVYVWNDEWLCMFCKRTETEINDDISRTRAL